MNEIWKPIKGFEGFYSISNMGRLRRDKRPNGIPLVVKNQHDRDGYCIYVLSVCNRPTTVKIHRLVASHFLKTLSLGRQVNHEDGNKDNNRWDNLTYMTNMENRQHAVLNGLHAKGERCGNAKLTEEAVVNIRREYELGGIRHQDLADQFGVGRKAITKIINRQRWARI